MREFYFVVNPASANGTTKTVWMEIGEYLKGKGIEYDFAFTTGPNHATQITTEAIKKGYKWIVAVGGDGTVNEVMNGFYIEGQFTQKAALGIISRGTGCDLIRTLGIPKEYQGAVEILQGKKTREIDLIKVEYLNFWGEKEQRYCINISDVGLGGYVAQRVNHTSKSAGGLWSYLRGTLLSILKYKNRQGKVIIDGQEVYDGRFSLIAAANGKYFGGGMKLAPMAELDDGYISTILLGNMGKVELLLNLAKVYDGSHLTHPKVKDYKAKEVVISSNERLPLEIDGENPGFGTVKYSIIEKAIKVIC
ncbi:diacylglycerol/lipid kinase family protein [Anaerobranca gottschalkii]|uniref:Lipid kinase, YegS/Rv2252/BmrU family n=1 Tax=Anaerobranca gottschalkii DSM 13577 TaxID=1120990 RepID=A0A1I0AKU4_9FIRM|nr:diacylglycerol kinase family protein [Anaerobranca gottschalkii]SES94975.1 lipid kinase, YegS/Rv2252/BmrU family [Anaerobranca gottschalkii DSM 13577]